LHVICTQSVKRLSQNPLFTDISQKSALHAICTHSGAEEVKMVQNGSKARMPTDVGEHPESPLFTGVLAERTGFEPAKRFCRLHAFQACILAMYVVNLQRVANTEFLICTLFARFSVS